MTKDVKSLHSVRVGDTNWLHEDRFEELLRLLKKHPCGVTQIALFTSPVHAPLTIAEMKRRVDIMKLRMARIREEGWSAGINILATIGHHNEDLDNTFNGSQYYRMTNIDGEVCRGSFCMNDERYIADYVRPVYTMLAEAAPDFIWVDDDVRYGHMPIGQGCYCDKCMEVFNAANGTDYTRATLKVALDSGNVDVRKRWLAKQAGAIAGLFRAIADTVYGIDPDIRLGFMTGERYGEGYDFAGWAEVLSQGGKHPIMWRPGGGAYTDIKFDDIVEKAEQIGRQNAYLPDYVTIIQSEIENFPYRMIDKTPTSTAAEVMLHITSGCTGAALNILPSETLEPLTTVEEHLKAITATAPFCELLSSRISDCAPRGIHSGWYPDSQAAVPAGDYDRKGGGMYGAYHRDLLRTGLPEAYHPDCADVVTLTGCSAAVLSDEQVLKLLSGGVYMDIHALRYLNERGFGRYTGFLPGRQLPVDAMEVYTDVPLNEGLADGVRNCRQAFTPGDSYEVVPAGEGCVSLARLVDYHGAEWCPCCLGLFENELGGRVCVAGYYPYYSLCDYRKSIQIKRIFAYLSGNSLLSWVEDFVRVRNMSFRKDGMLYVTLFNPSNETWRDVNVRIRTGAESAVLYDQRCSSAELRADAVGDGYSRFTVSELRPYEMVLIEAHE